MINIPVQYLPKEIGKYGSIDWYSWQAWLWPRKLPLANGVTFDEISIETRQRRQQPIRRSVTSATTSVFVTPRTSPPREVVFLQYSCVYKCL